MLQKMKMHSSTLLVLALAFSCFEFNVLAHIPFFEPQLFDASPAGDWTFEAPFIVPLDAAAGFSPSLNNSRAITSVLGLTPEDTYDVATFEITENNPQQVMIGLQALAPNCPAEAPLSSATFFPSVALLGPSTDPKFTKINQSTLDTLPFSIPDMEYGAIIRNQPQVPLFQRAVYSAGPFNSYLLPYPVTPDCIETEEAFSNCSNGDAAQTSVITDVKLTTPGKYYIVWWNPDDTTPATPAPSLENMPAMEETKSMPRQVTVSFGIGEGPTPREQELQIDVITGQKVPAFNPCTGAFVAPPVFAGAGLMHIAPSME